MQATSQPSHPMQIFLERSQPAEKSPPQGPFDLVIDLALEARCHPFEPITSLLRYSFSQLTSEQVEQVFRQTRTFEVLKPIVRCFLEDRAVPEREPLNTDELAYEQIEIRKALSQIIERVARILTLKVAVTGAEHLPPSTVTLLEQMNYRLPKSIEINLFFSQDSLSSMKFSEDFSHRIRRRHQPVPRGTAESCQAANRLSPADAPGELWTMLFHSIQLYAPDEVLMLAHQLARDPDLTPDDQSKLLRARLFAHMLLNNVEYMHICLQELQHQSLAKLPVNEQIKVRQTVCLAMLVMQDFNRIQKAVEQYQLSAADAKSNRHQTLARFYQFQALCHHGNAPQSQSELEQLCRDLKDLGWRNLAAFVQCSHWFNPDLLNRRPDQLIEACQRSITVFEDMNNVIGQSTAQHHISIVLGAAGQPQAAIVHINRALQLTQQSGLDQRIHNTLNGLAFLLNGLGQTDAAIDALEAAYPRALIAGHIESICTTLYNLALVAFYGNYLRSAQQILDDIFSIMEMNGRTSIQFRTREEMLAMQAIAAYLDGDQQFAFAIAPQLHSVTALSHEGEAFIRCIQVLTQTRTVDECEKAFIASIDHFGGLRQNTHLELIALRLLSVYLAQAGEPERSETWRQTGRRQCREYNLDSRLTWFSTHPSGGVLNTRIDTRQALALSRHRRGVDTLKLENGLLKTLSACRDSALRSASLDDLLSTFLSHLIQLAQVHDARIELTANGERYQVTTDGNLSPNSAQITEEISRPLRFIGGEGALSIRFYGDLLHDSYTAAFTVQQIAEQLTRTVELVLERMTSYREIYMDPLTRIYNRRAFDEDVTHLLKMQPHRTLTIAYIDLDQFKAVNDTLGHLAGDQLLRDFVDDLTQKVRAEDRVYRIGGDEFLVSFLDVELRQTKRVFQRVRQSFLDPERLQAFGWKDSKAFGFSVGIVEFPASVQPHMTPEALLAATDKLMYQAKKSSRGFIRSQVYV